MRLDEVRPRHVRDMVRALRPAGDMAPRTVLRVVPTRNLTTSDASDAVHAFKADLEALGLRVEAGEHRDRGGA
ncbi:MAG TPA: hypothetical protein VGP07_08555 [Polyangia bacterium]|jgi:hypothetical protein|nr:hypothetical protein [Kofleriaceae bacterium]